MRGAGPPSLHGGGTPTAERGASCCFAFRSLRGVLREDAVAAEDVMVTGPTGWEHPRCGYEEEALPLCTLSH